MRDSHLDGFECKCCKDPADKMRDGHAFCWECYKELYHGEIRCNNIHFLHVRGDIYTIDPKKRAGE